MPAMTDVSFQRRMVTVIRLAGGVSTLAAKTGLSQRVIAKYRNGESDPSRERLVAIARASGVAVDWLATGEGPLRVDVDAAARTSSDEDLIRAVTQYVLTADARADEPRSAEELAEVIARFVAHAHETGLDAVSFEALRQAVDHVMEFAPRQSGRKA